MASTHSGSENPTDQVDPFTATDPVQFVDDAILAACRQPDQIGDGEEMVFAVAFRHGVVTHSSRGAQYQADAVLYLTADAEQAVERYFSNGIESAPRACLVAEHELDDATVGRSYRDALRLHPEVHEQL